MVRFKLAVIISVAHCIVGNIIGVYTDMSSFAGWDSLSYILELGSLLIMLPIFYAIAMLVIKEN